MEQTKRRRKKRAVCSMIWNTARVTFGGVSDGRFRRVFPFRFGQAGFHSQQAIDHTVDGFAAGGGQRFDGGLASLRHAHRQAFQLAEVFIRILFVVFVARGAFTFPP